MNVLLLMIFLLPLFYTNTVCAATPTVSLTTSYVSPVGQYKELRLSRMLASEPALANPCTMGIFVIDQNGDLQFCDDVGGNGQWTKMSPAWNATGNNIYPTDTANNANLRVGIGTSVPLSKLHLNSSLTAGGVTDWVNGSGTNQNLGNESLTISSNNAAINLLGAGPDLVAAIKLQEETALGEYSDVWIVGRNSATASNAGPSVPGSPFYIAYADTTGAGNSGWWITQPGTTLTSSRMLTIKPRCPTGSATCSGDGFVGIGPFGNPAGNLHILGQGQTTTFRVQNNSLTPNNIWDLVLQNNVGNSFIIGRVDPNTQSQSANLVLIGSTDPAVPGVVAGNVGIGTTAPKEKLEILNTPETTPGSGVAAIKLRDTGDVGEVGSIIFSGGCTSTAPGCTGTIYERARVDGSRPTGSSGGGLTFSTRDNLSGIVKNRMYINDIGKISINQPTAFEPLVDLHVLGGGEMRIQHPNPRISFLDVINSSTYDNVGSENDFDIYVNSNKFQIRSDTTNSTGPGNISGSYSTKFILQADGRIGLNGYTTAVNSTAGCIVQASATGCLDSNLQWINPSSRSFKEGIGDLTKEEAYKAFNELKPVSYRYKEEAGSKKHLGFIAEDVPDLVASQERKSLQPMDFIAVLTKVVQAQDEQIKEQNKIIAQQQKEIDEIKRKLNKAP